jgi:transposase
MKYTVEQRLDIGRRIYEGELTRFQAAAEYGINDNTARSYMWLYRDTNNLPPKNSGRKKATENHKHSPSIEAKQPDLETYEAMTKEELIQALVQARITETRLKKGYEVKGDGSIIQYSSKNTK